MVVIFLNFLLLDGDSKEMPGIGFCLHNHSDDRRSGCLVTKLLASLAATLTPAPAPQLIKQHHGCFHLHKFFITSCS